MRLLHDTNFKYNSIQNQNGQSGNITEAFIKDCLKLDKNNTYYADTLYEFYKNYYKLFYTGALLPKYVLQKKYVNYCQLALIKNPAIHVPITDMPLSELMLTREGYVPVRPFVCIVGAGGLALEPCIFANYQAANVSNHKRMPPAPVHEIGFPGFTG